MSEAKRRPKPPAPTIPFRDRLTVRAKDIAAYTGMSTSTVDRLIATDLPKPDVRIGRIVAWYPQTIIKFLEKQRP